MKTKIFNAMMACAFCTGQALAGNILTVTGAEVPVGGEGVVEIGCEFDTEFTAFELQLSLAEGLTIVQDEEGNPVAECGFAGSHIVRGNVLPSNGNCKFVCYSMEKASLPMSGTLLRVRVKADEGLAHGSTLSANIVGQEFVRTDNSEGELLTDKEMPVPVREVKARKADDSVYDLQGRRTTKRGAGIYITGGRKEIGR